MLRIARIFNLDADLARRGRYQVFRERTECALQQCFDQGLQRRSVSEKGCAVYRKALNRLPEDPRQSTSANPEVPQAHPLAAANGRESAAKKPWQPSRPADALGSDRPAARSGRSRALGF